MARRIVPTSAPIGSGIPIFPTAGGPAPLLVCGPPIRFKLGQAVDSKGNPIIVILTNQQQAILDYTRATPNMALADNLFTSALVGRLAGKLVGPLSGDKQLAKIAMQDGQISEGIAAARDANENYGETIERGASWMTARGASEDEAGDGFTSQNWSW